MDDLPEWVWLAFSAFLGSTMAEAGPFARRYLGADDAGRVALKHQYGDRVYVLVRLVISLCVAYMATMGATPTKISAFILGLSGLNASDFFVQRKDEAPPKAHSLPSSVTVPTTLTPGSAEPGVARKGGGGQTSV